MGKSADELQTSSLEDIAVPRGYASKLCHTAEHKSEASEAASEASEAPDLMRNPSQGGPSNQGKRPPRGSVVAADFIKADHMDSEKEESPARMTVRQKVELWATWCVGNYYVGNFMAFVVLVDAVCTWVDIDARAADATPAPFFVFFSDFSLGLYTVEVFLLLISKGACGVLHDWMALLDITIVGCGYLEILMNAFASDLVANLSVMRALRLARIFRLLRLFRRIRALRELQKLVTMMATCLRTLAWSFLLCFVVMTIWAMLMVEVVNPIVREMAEDPQSIIADCEYCKVSTSSVIEANLLLFKTVIAGDSWGEVAVPVIQRNPETAVLFVGSLLTLVFGVLNIIVAVVVDTFAEARQNDILNLAEEMEEDIEKDKEALAKLFERIDKDGSGQLTFEELIQGARRDPVFQSRLRVMDIDENDLQQLFSMIDVDNSGNIEVAEFIGPLSRWVHDSKTAPRFIKYNMLQTMQLQEDMYSLSKHYFGYLSERIDSLATSVSLLTARHDSGPSSPSPQISQTLARLRPAVETAEVSEDQIEQPHSSSKPETLRLAECLSALSSQTLSSQGDEFRPIWNGMDLRPLLDAAVMKVEIGMLEMESRLKRAFAGLPDGAPGAMPAFRDPSRKPSNPPTSSQDMKAFRHADLFKAVYGDGKIRRRSKKDATSGIAQLAFAHGAGVQPRRGSEDALAP